jgi:hypothetical protein
MVSRAWGALVWAPTSEPFPLRCIVINREEAAIKINRRSSFLRPLLVTALPFGLLAAGAMSAQAGTVTVTGANEWGPDGRLAPGAPVHSPYIRRRQQLELE